jgi:hypothetical protein
MPIMCNSSGVWEDATGGGGTEVETGYLTESSAPLRAASTARWWKIGNLVIVRATADGYHAQDIQLPWSSTPVSVSDTRFVGYESIQSIQSAKPLTRTCTISTDCKITFSDTTYTSNAKPTTFWLATVVTE